MSGSVAGLLRYYAEAEPRELYALEKQVRAEADDPQRQSPTQVEARRRLLARIGEARQLVRQ